MATTPVILRSKPGIKRDGTRYEGDFYVDGEWCRFQRGLPRKIGGYQSVERYLPEISRGMKTYTENGATYVHSGSAGLLERFAIVNNASSTLFDRTPITLNADDKNLWQFDVMYDSVGVPPQNTIIAQVAPNAGCLCSSAPGQMFIGSLIGTERLVEITPLPTGTSLSGGICVLHPYLTYFGSDGFLGWSVAGKPSDLTGVGSGNARIAGQKIVRGLPLRGGPGNAPAGLFWSADAVIRASFVGGTSVFQFDTISSQSSVLSAASIIEFDGIYFWCGTDRFLMFNGVVREVPNELNLNFFFDNLNRPYSSRVFAFKVPRFGEIWWCFPKGNSTECNHAVIYNVRENTWYDTALPAGGRTAGEFSPLMARPILSGATTRDESNTQVVDFRVTESGDRRVTEGDDPRITQNDEGYEIWLHETGVDKIDSNLAVPIISYFETADMSAMANPQGGKNQAIRVDILEPDFVQSGNMTVQMTGRANAKSKEIEGEIKTIFANPATPDQQLVYFKDQRRELRFKFTSNELGGDYQMGQIIAHIEPIDSTMLGAVSE